LNVPSVQTNLSISAPAIAHYSRRGYTKHTCDATNRPSVLLEASGLPALELAAGEPFLSGDGPSRAPRCSVSLGVPTGALALANDGSKLSLLHRSDCQALNERLVAPTISGRYLHAAKHYRLTALCCLRPSH